MYTPGLCWGKLMAQAGRTDEGINTMSSLIEDDEHISMRIVRSQMQLQQGTLEVLLSRKHNNCLRNPQRVSR